MTTAVRTNSDGQPRKTLASQLDRLDGILDGLDRALTGAVQDAVEQAVKQAVQAVLAEVLTNRERGSCALPGVACGGCARRCTARKAAWRCASLSIGSARSASTTSAGSSFSRHNCSTNR